MLATSDHPSDDLLSELAKELGMPVYRGSLDNVLGRFVDATAEMNATDYCVRLTADNFLPEGNLIDSLLGHIKNTGARYLNSHQFLGPHKPRGLSAEVFEVGLLRQTGKLSQDAIQQEHVTLPMRNLSSEDFSSIDERYSYTSIDTLDDYLQCASGLSQCADIIKLSWPDLLACMSRSPAIRPVD